MAAQARRGAETPIARFQPPGLESGKGTSALEEESDVMLLLFRPLGRWSAQEQQHKPLTRGDLAKVERGELEVSDVLLPHTMGVKVLKHRRNGDLSGKIIKLHCERGMLANHRSGFYGRSV